MSSVRVRPGLVLERLTVWHDQVDYFPSANVRPGRTFARTFRPTVYDDFANPSRTPGLSRGRKRALGRAARRGQEAFLKRALVKRAASLAAPQKRLKKSMDGHVHGAPLDGPTRHFINEIEIHPGYYVDWDDTPDLTIEPLARAYGDYLTMLAGERR